MGLLRRYQSTVYGNYKKAWLLYGLYTGLILCFSTMLRYWLTYPMESPSSWIDNVVLFLSMVLFTLVYRKKLADKKIFFKEVYILNIGIGIIAAMVYGIFLLFYGYRMDPEFVQRYYEAQEIIYRQNWAESSELLAEKLTQLKEMATTKYLSMMGFILTAVTSLILAFIVALFFRTQKNIVREKK